MPFTDSNLIILVTLITFLSIFLLSIGIGQYIRQKEKRNKIIEKIRRGGEANLFFEEKKLKTTHIPENPFLKFLVKLGERIKPENLYSQSKLRAKIFQTGIRKESSTSIFWGAKCLFTIVFPLIFILIRIPFFNVVSHSLTIAISVILALIGFYLPDAVLKIMIDRRKVKIFEELPDAIDLFVVCTEAGMGLDAAISKTANEMATNNSVLSEELKFFNLEIRAGKSRQHALRNLARRTDLEELNSLVTLLIQADRFGTGIAKTLRVFSDSFRNTRYLKAEEIAAKLPVKLVVPLILFIFPALFVVLVGPVAINIYQNLLTK
ncbi:MAG: type II secretion system F family protein [Desulfobacterales bacterium]